MLNLSKMEYKQNRYNLADISTISESSSCTIREQVSQLDLDIKGCLHSTFNYPLHSTINFVDISMNFSQSSGSSKTLVDSDNTLVKLNENLRASDIKDSTVMSKESSSVKNTSCDTTIKIVNTTKNSCDRTSNAEPEILLPDQSYPTKASYSSVNSLNNNNAEDSLLLDCDSDCESDCDSSCLSFDVDDMSLCIDSPIKVPSTTTKSVLPLPDNQFRSCYINHMIHNQVGAQMWGNDYSRSVSSIAGDCDVCKLMKMKRQRACTDLWTGPRGPFEDPSSLLSTIQEGKSILSSTRYSTTSSNINSTRSSFASKRSRTDSLDSLHGSSKRRNTISNSETLSPSISRRVRKPSRTPTRKHKRINEDLGSRESFLRKYGSDIGERLHPEGMEDDKENSHPSVTSVTSVWCDSTKSASRLQTISENDSGFSSTNSSAKFRNSLSGDSYSSSKLKYQLNRVSTKSANVKHRRSSDFTNQPEFKNTLHYSTPSTNSSRRSRDKPRRLSSVSKPTTPFCDAIPTPSPWKGDKKLIKRKLKELSLNIQHADGQSNIQTLGCF